MQTRRKRLALQLQRRRGQIDAEIVGDPRSLQRGRASAGIATRDIEKAEGLDDLLDQDPVQAGIRFPMAEIVLLDHRAINPPVLLEHGLRRLVLPVCNWLGIVDGVH